MSCPAMGGRSRRPRNWPEPFMSQHVKGFSVYFVRVSEKAMIAQSLSQPVSQPPSRRCFADVALDCFPEPSAQRARSIEFRFGDNGWENADGQRDGNCADKS